MIDGLRNTGAGRINMEYLWSVSGRHCIVVYVDGGDENSGS